MEQIALPLKTGSGSARIILGISNNHVAEALLTPESWPYRTAILTGPPRSGKSSFARWFSGSGKGESVDDAWRLGEDDLFHRWNRAQEHETPLLLVGGDPPWAIALPDLKSRLMGSLQLEIGQPDDAMAKELLLSMAAERSLNLPVEAADYLVPRASRAQADLEELVETIDRLSLERKAPPSQGIWRAALETLQGPEEPRLI